MVKLDCKKFLLCCCAAVLTFFIAGLLYLLCLKHVDNLGAYSIPSETGLLIPSVINIYFRFARNSPKTQQLWKVWIRTLGEQVVIWHEVKLASYWWIEPPFGYEATSTAFSSPLGTSAVAFTPNQIE